MELTNAQWQVVAPLIPEPPRRPDGRGRPAREILDGILWILRTGAPWRDLPARYPPYQTTPPLDQYTLRESELYES